MMLRKIAANAAWPVERESRLLRTVLPVRSRKNSFDAPAPPTIARHENLLTKDGAKDSVDCGESALVGPRHKVCDSSRVGLRHHGKHHRRVNRLVENDIRDPRLQKSERCLKYDGLRQFAVYTMRETHILGLLHAQTLPPRIFVSIDGKEAVGIRDKDVFKLSAVANYFLCWFNIPYIKRCDRLQLIDDCFRHRTSLSAVRKRALSMLECRD